MKYLMLIALSALVPNQAFADEMPAYMKDATITVKLKDGSSHTFSANDHKVVDRLEKKKVAFVPALHKETPKAKKTRVSVLAGYGLNGKLNVTNGPSTANISQQSGLVGGLAVQRDVSKNIHIMGEALTNSTFLLGVGSSF